MTRLILLAATCITLCCNVVAQQTQVSLPDENGLTQAINYDYFPDRMYAFVWRNWTVVPKSRLAQILGTSTRNVEALARSMGLAEQPTILPEWSQSRGYITVLRRNWHLLPYDQILELLGMSREELKFRLIEDDFLYVKLGNVKPQCAPLRYTQPTAEMQRKAAVIARDMQAIGKQTFGKETPRFGFFDDFSDPLPQKADSHKDVKTSDNSYSNADNDEGFSLRMIYPYFSDYGDPLLDEELSSYPEGLFSRLADAGVNGIWLHSVLRMMMLPDADGFPGDSEAPRRIEGLKRLVARAAKYGIKIYLYVNEPRAMDAEYFEADAARMNRQGVAEGQLRAFCTSDPQVRSWLSRSMQQLFSEVEGLGGVFTITGSENLTSCASHGGQAACPRCSKRPYAEIIADVNTAIAEGVKRGNPEAKVIVWDWGWRDSECENIINRLPKECMLMSVSEWSLPINRGGIETAIGEYSLSTTGVGPRAMRNWEYARRAGLKTAAKMQVNCSWEMAAVPAIPVLDLVAQKAENLSKQHTDGVMLSWTLGGFPSENLKLFQSFRAGESKEQALDRLAEQIYGRNVAADIRRAWTACSEGYAEYPFYAGSIYFGPQHTGPSNPFYFNPTGYAATMVNLPYDNEGMWRGIYPAEVWQSQLAKCVAGFDKGVEILAAAERKASGKYAKTIRDERVRCEAVRIHLQSMIEQSRFVNARNNYLKEGITEAQRTTAIDQMRQACLAEQQLIKELLPLVKRDPTIGYESSNQYFYLPIDLAEAYISICDALRRIEQ